MAFEMMIIRETSCLTNLQSTKGEVANHLYPAPAYEWDAALPQSWLQAAYESGSDTRLPNGNIASHYVMVYPKDGSPFIGAITLEGVQELGRLAATI